MMSSGSVRIQAWRSGIRRIGRRLSQLEQRHKRLSWYRLVVFLFSLLLSFVAGFLVSGALGLGILATGIIAFGILALVHRRLETAYRRHQLWIKIKQANVARAQLDWDSIPSPPPAVVAQNHPFAHDLDLFGHRSLHHLIDIASSSHGSLKLQGWLAQAIPDLNQTRSRQRIVKDLTPLSRFRDRFLLTFAMAGGGRLQGERLETWLGLLPPAAHLKTGLLYSILLLLANDILLVSYLAGWLLVPYWEISLAAYFLFYILKSRPVRSVLDSAVLVDDLLSSLARVLAFLENYPCEAHPRLGELCALFKAAETRPSRQLTRAKSLSALAGLRMNPIVAVILNLLVPWDFLVAHRIARQGERLRTLIPLWLDQCAELEALLSLANFSYVNPGYTFPRVEQAAGLPAFEAENLGHPLIPAESKVTNTFLLGRTQIVVLTGSNMSGKSTFIRTVGINLVLAYAGAAVDAASLQTSLARVFTCIRVTDSVQDHVSSFYAEVRRLKQLLDALEHPDSLPMFYLIDEIFRGTNNRERLIGSESFMEALVGQRGAGIITTHDLELARLSDKLPGVRNYHFREDIQGDRMVFDYRLRKGPSPTTNALKIMQMEGLPVRPVDEPL
jgi:ABC-type multidrug transport system fused ATPase/permease subunit